MIWDFTVRMMAQGPAFLNKNNLLTHRGQLNVLIFIISPLGIEKWLETNVKKESTTQQLK